MLMKGGRECTKSGRWLLHVGRILHHFLRESIGIDIYAIKNVKMYFHLTRPEIRHKMKNVRRKVSVLNHRAGQTLQQNTTEAQSSLFLTSLSLNCSRLRRMSPRWQHLEKAPGAGSCTTCTRGHQPGGRRGKSCFNFNGL